MHEGEFNKTRYCANRNEVNLEVKEIYILNLISNARNKLTYSWLTDKGTKNMQKRNNDI